MARNVVVLLNSEQGRNMVAQKCKQLDLPLHVLEQLIEAELDQQGKRRKRGLYEEFDEIFDSLAQESR